MGKKLIIKFSMLLAMLVGLNFIYARWFYEKDIQKHSEVINKVRAIPDDADIIYLGESSNYNSHPDDADTRRISEFIGDYFPELTTCDISRAASHAGIFKVLLQNIPASCEVQTIVVTMNLRSFNAQWVYSDLETPLQKSMVLIKRYPPLLNRFLLSFKAYDIKTDKEREAQFKAKWKRDEFELPFDFQFNNVIEWDSWMAMNGVRDENGDYDKELTPLACHYIKAFGFQIDTLNHPRINDFNKIVDIAERRGWNLVFNLMAENTEQAALLVGGDLIYMMEQNASILSNYYENRGVTVVDNLHAVSDSLFTDRTWTTEHYSEKGRKAIAANVALALKSLHEMEFSDYQIIE